MKSIKVILTIFMFFSILNNSFATEGEIEKALDINYGIEDFEMNLDSISDVSFETSKNQEKLSKMVNLDEVLKTEIMRKYRKGDFDYNRVSGIIANHSKFVYYTNKYFYYLKRLENGDSSKENQTFLLKSYKSLKSYYSRLKVLALKK